MFQNSCSNPLARLIASTTLAVANSAVSWWITRQSFASKQGGFYEFKPMYISQLPIPAATPEQQQQCERLAEALIWSHRPGVAKKADDAPAVSGAGTKETKKETL